jgi:hypothetical protein
MTCGAQTCRGSGAAAPRIAVAGALAAPESVDGGASDGWWSPRAAAATEISRAAAASLAETDVEPRFPQI